MQFTILAGGFTSFIASYSFDSNASTLTLLSQNPTGENPSWIASHPQNKSILYAVNEIAPIGNLQSFSVASDGRLILQDTVTTGGNGPTFTAVLSTGEVTGMNFGSGSCSLVPTISGSPLQFQQGAPVVTFPVPEGAPSNPHMSLEFNGEVFVPDFGADKIWRLVNDGGPGQFKVQGQINIDPGTGPRHIAIRDNVLFTVHETASTLTAQLIPPAPNGTTYPLLANVSIIPPDQPTGSEFAGAEIIIPPTTDTFPDPLIYVSNRNIGNVTDPRGDTIAIFEFNNGTSATVNGSQSTGVCRRMWKRNASRRQQDGGASLNLVAQVFTGLDQIRGMMIGNVDDGGDAFIAAGANVGTGGVAIFQRIDGGRNLTEVARSKDIPTRTSFVFV